jgi:isoleucyl-tRNA synthetase
VFNTYGADALRWYMVSSPLLSGGDLAMPKDGKAIGEAIRAVMLPLWNAYSFFTLYANIDGIQGRLVTTAEAELDRYILGKTAELVRAVESAMDRLDLAAAATRCRRSSRRSTTGTSAARASASGKRRRTPTSRRPTTRSTPCWSRPRGRWRRSCRSHRDIHRALVDGESVHLQDWPDASAFDVDAALVERMDLARDVASAAASIRTAKNLRNRLPLAKLTVAHPDHARLSRSAK